MGRQATSTRGGSGGVKICYLKATQACVKRGFVVPKDDAWAYPIETPHDIDIQVVCGDCKEFEDTRKGTTGQGPRPETGRKGGGGRQESSLSGRKGKLEICYLKITEPCLKRGFVVPEGDAWVYAASSALVTTICGDCRKYVKLQRKRKGGSQRAKRGQRSHHGYDTKQGLGRRVLKRQNRTKTLIA